MRRGIWTGSISFGLIQIDVSLQTARQGKGLHFKMLDRKDKSPVGHQYYNKNTGAVLQYQETEKGYEIEKGRFVVLTPADFKSANPKASRMLDLEAFIDLKEVDTMLYGDVYYLVPAEKALKPYALLRETLGKTEKAGVGRIVMRQKQHICAVMQKGDYLVCQILHFPNEIIQSSEADYLPRKDLNIKVNPKELNMAETLVNSMAGEWDPSQFKDEYTADVMKMIKAKAAGKKIRKVEVEPEPSSDNIIKLGPLLEQSLKRAIHKSGGKTQKKSATKKRARA